jgi:glyoxylase-like metal-dependent hydrolase (beta-lactamase superfamily II)
MRTLTSVLGNSQRLDGGALFGNAPRTMWQALHPPDDHNRIPLACRCLLVRDDRRLILFETGVGAFFEPALRERYGILEPEHVLLAGLAALDIAPDDIDVIVLSHLHFDHAGGTLAAWADGAAPSLVFPRATYVVGSEAWDRAQRPHPRDRASFIPGLPELIAETGRLEIVTGDRSATLGDGYRLHRSFGHTPGLLLAEVEMPDGPVVYTSDLVAGRAWVHLPMSTGYDRYPELTVDEKAALYADLLPRRGRLFFTHDPEIAMARLARDAKGRYHAAEPQPALRDLDH